MTFDPTKLLSVQHTYVDRATYERRVAMSALMFEPITDDKEIQDTLNSRSGKGEAETFLKGLESAYQAFTKINENKGKPFIVPLNEREGAKFFGKKTDSLYASVYGTLKRLELTKVWRLVRVKKDDDTFLRIVRL